MRLPQLSPASGREETAPTERTPGKVRTPARSSSKNAEARAVEAGENARTSFSSTYLCAGSDTSAVSTPCGSNPGSTRSRRYMLFMSRPAPASRTTASATSATTSALVSRRRPGVAAGAVSLSDSRRSIADPCRAGAIPKRTPVRSETSSVNASTEPSTFTGRMRGSTSYPSALTASAAQYASARPARPPRTASSTLSVRSCRRMRPRLAPSAARMAISRRRAAARTRSKLARFAQAMRRVKATAPSRTAIAGRSSPNVESARDVTSIVRLRDSGNSSAMPRAMPATSVRACSSVTPGRRRPKTPTK